MTDEIFDPRERRATWLHLRYTEAVESRPVYPSTDRQVERIAEIYRSCGFFQVPFYRFVPTEAVSVPERSPYETPEYLRREILSNDSLADSWSVEFSHIPYGIFLRSVAVLAVVTLHRRGAIKTCCAAIRLRAHEVPRPSELSRFVQAFEDHRSEWERDPERYYRTYVAFVPSGVFFVTVLAESYRALVGAVRQERLSGGFTLNERQRVRIAKGLLDSGAPVSRRGLAYAFDVPERRLMEMSVRGGDS